MVRWKIGVANYDQSLAYACALNLVNFGPQKEKSQRGPRIAPYIWVP